MELKISQLKQAIIGGINESELPLSLVSYILKDVLQEVDMVRAEELKQEAEAMQQASKEVEKVDAEIVE